jgi:hypothetical protein
MFRIIVTSFLRREASLKARDDPKLGEFEGALKTDFSLRVDFSIGPFACLKAVVSIGLAKLRRGLAQKRSGGQVDFRPINWLLHKLHSFSSATYIKITETGLRPMCRKLFLRVENLPRSRYLLAVIAASTTAAAYLFIYDKCKIPILLLNLFRSSQEILAQCVEYSVLDVRFVFCVVVATLPFLITNRIGQVIVKIVPNGLKVSSLRVEPLPDGLTSAFLRLSHEGMAQDLRDQLSKIKDSPIYLYTSRDYRLRTAEVQATRISKEKLSRVRSLAPRIKSKVWRSQYGRPFLNPLSSKFIASAVS